MVPNQTFLWSVILRLGAPSETSRFALEWGIGKVALLGSYAHSPIVFAFQTMYGVLLQREQLCVVDGHEGEPLGRVPLGSAGPTRREF